MKNFKENIKIISIIIGTFIGAGFASGKEINEFFAKFGIYGIVGSIVSSALTGIIIYMTTMVVKKYNIETNNEFIDRLSSGKSKKITNCTKKILKNIINVFLIISFFIMVAGFSAYFKQQYEIPLAISSGIIGVILYFTFLNNIEGIMKINTITIPVLIFILIYLIVKPTGPINLENINIENNFIKAMVMSISYASYNSIILIPIIISLNKHLKDKKQIKSICYIIVAIIATLSVGLIKIILTSNLNIENVELPIIKILEKNKIEQLLYSLVLIIAIFTSAVSAGYGFLENIKNARIYKKIAWLLCILGIASSYIGFGKLVVLLYPIFGIVGVLQIILIVRHYKKIE